MLVTLTTLSVSFTRVIQENQLSNIKLNGIIQIRQSFYHSVCETILIKI